MTTPSAHSAARAGDATAADTSNLAKAMDDLTGQTLGDFKLLRKLGAGGMGQVYLAEQHSLKRRVAVKLLRSDLNSHEKFRKRFETEAKAAAQLSHPSIVQVHAVGEHDGLMFMALEYVEGWTLKDYLLRKGPPDVPIALSIMRQVAAALTRAAELGIVHRDIKPENILLTRKVEVKVTDFGLAKILAGMENENLTQTGVSMGTPLYMSPEQVQGLPLDPRSDIYCFGATCYHMLSGQPPFTAESAIALAFKHVQEEPIPLEKLRPDLPPELCAVVSKMMAKKADQRYQSAREILRDLKKLAEGKTLAPSGPVAKLPVPPDVKPLSAETTEEFFDTSAVHRRRWPWILGGSLFVAIVFGIIVGLMLRGDRDKPVVSAAATGSSTVAPKTTSSNPNRPTGSSRPQTSANNKTRETLLRDEIKRTDTLAQISVGTRCRVDMFFYLLKEQNPPDLVKLEEFVAQLRNSEVRHYKTLGLVGNALLLSWQGQAKQAVVEWKRLMDMPPVEVVPRPNRPLLPNREVPPVMAMLRMNDLRLAILISEAIEMNINKVSPLPDEVQRLHDEAKRRSKSVNPRKGD